MMKTKTKLKRKNNWKTKTKTKTKNKSKRKSHCLVMTNCPVDGRGQGHVTSSFFLANKC